MNGKIVNAAGTALAALALWSLSSFAAAEDPVFSPAFFWLWNDRLDAKSLCAQLEDMRAHGLRNVCIHPLPKAFRPATYASNMEPDYLTEGFLDVYSKVVRRAGELGMHCYLYDEGGWPSGGACGKVVASDPDGRFATRQLVIGADGSTKVRTRGHQKGYAAHPSLVEKGVVQKFIELTHDAYAKVLGGDLGRTVRIAFTDEPCHPANRHGDHYGWASDFPEEFLARKGYDVMPRMAEAIRRGEDTDDGLARIRIDVQDVMSDLFVERYLLPIRDWCRGRGVMSGGHLNGEDVPERAPECGHGSLLRGLRALDVPGVDAICRQLFPATATSPASTRPFPRYASSAMHQNGGRLALSESFAIYGESLSPAQAKWVVDYQIARGINTFVFGAYAQSSAGQWMTVFEPHAGPVVPQWDFQPHFFGYVERTCRFMSQGRPGAEIAVLFDMRGFWAGGDDRKAAAASHYAVASSLDRMNCDYDFVDDDQIAAAEILSGGRIRIGAMEYRALVLPTSKWMKQAAREKCDAFRAKGGVVADADGLAAVPRTLAVSGMSEAIRVLKRRDGRRTIWFVMNEDMEDREVTMEFPGYGPVVRYDPERDVCERASDGPVLSRVFGGGETAIYVTGDVPPAKWPAVYGGPRLELGSGWTLRPLVSHEADGDDIRRKPCGDGATPVSLGDWRGALGGKFSGKAVYRVEFDSDSAGEALLDLGEVKWCASARLNGVELGARFFGPFRWPVELRKGRNVLEVTVANLLVNQVGDDALRDRVIREFPPKGAYDACQRAYDRLNQESGLFGPVSIAMRVRRSPTPQWISGDSQPREKPAPVLERRFDLDAAPTSAVFEIAVAGWCEVRVNGAKAGEDVLSPVTCQPDSRLSRLRLDVARLLRPGENRIEVLLGNGWFNCFSVCTWRFADGDWLAAPQIRGSLTCDGRTVLVTDGDWRAYDSPIVFNSLRNGERYDARREGKRLNERPAKVEKYSPAGRESPEIAAPCRVFEAFDPVRTIKAADGADIYDFGANIAGWCEVEAQGEPGAKLTFDYDESLTPSNTLLGHITRHVTGKGDPDLTQHDEYTLAGRPGGEAWHPRFTYHGFRYVKVAKEGAVNVKSIRARFVHSAFEKAGSIETSDPSFAALQSAVERSYLSNFVGIPTDCPHREKNGWTGDTQLAMETGLWNYGAKGSYEHFLRMVLDAQRPNGSIPCIVPCSQKFGYGWGSGPTFDAILFEIPWQIYRHFGDDRPAREAWAGMKAYLAFIDTKANADGLFAYGLGDWNSPDARTRASLRVTDSAYVYSFNRRAAFWAGRFGEADAAAAYSRRADDVKAAFNAAFYKGRGLYADGKQTELAAPLFFKGLCRDGEEAAVAERLVRAVRANSHRADFGILGAKWVPRVLSDYGYVDDAWRIFTQPEMPGWMHWLSFGDGTLREEWDDRHSHNHIMFGDLSAWAYEYIAGIVPVEPGFAKVAVRPHFPKGVESFSAVHRTPRGEIRVSWRRGRDGRPVVDWSLPKGVELVESPIDTSAK